MNSDKTMVRLLLTDDELQLPAIDNLCNKFQDWLALTKEKRGGRKTRSANKRADDLFQEILDFRLPPLTIHAPVAKTLNNANNTNQFNHNPATTSANTSSIDSSDEECTNRPITRSLRSRSRTPSAQQQVQQQQQRKPSTSPSTPTHQRLRAYLKQPASGASSNCSSGSANVLSAALNQQHPSVSVTKIRQLLRADSAQKKRDEERERQERIRIDRKAKEERAEAQKRQLLEERAQIAKLKREERLKNAAEVRKLREFNEKREIKLQERYREERTKKLAQQQQIQQQQQQQLQQQAQQQHNNFHHNHHDTPKPEPGEDHSTRAEKQDVPDHKPDHKPGKKENAKALNETFKKPKQSVDNIDIVINDETSDEPTPRNDNVAQTASWARSPYLREALVKQFSKSDSERKREVATIFAQVQLPIDLKSVFGTKYAGPSRYLVRTSSAVWTPPHKPVKRTSSMVMTPNDNH